MPTRPGLLGRAVRALPGPVLAVTVLGTALTLGRDLVGTSVALWLALALLSMLLIGADLLVLVGQSRQHRMLQEQTVRRLARAEPALRALRTHPGGAA